LPRNRILILGNSKEIFQFQARIGRDEIGFHDNPNTTLQLPPMTRFLLDGTISRQPVAIAPRCSMNFPRRRLCSHPLWHPLREANRFQKKSVMPP
jgi:hypothetical protein